MNTRFSALLMASLTGLMLSSPVLAGPFPLNGEWIVARDERDSGKQEERDAGKAKKQPDKKAGQKTEDEDRERGYGYGYERRSLQPSQYDDRGRR
jgi:hypothetical protein